MDLQLLLNPSIHKEASMLFIVNLFGSLLPLVFGVLMALVFTLWQGWDVFFDNGELYLYSAGFFTQAMYALYKLKRGSATNIVDILFWVSFAVFVISAFLYSALATSLTLSLSSESKINFDHTLLYWTSTISFIASLLIFYISVCIDMAQSSVDVQDEENKAIEDIKQQIS